MFEVCDGALPLTSSEAPRAGGADERLARIAPARRTAPSTLSRPAPCSRLLKSFRGLAVYSRIALTMFGVRPGLRCKRRAAAPATAGAAIEVPLMYIILCSMV